ncbi:YwgA family protein [Salisediminibacterium halotolerans]|uniref:YwgA family protein n=1 Tax=Salisediminibacterium halotolerans TaxID=517425 RepID=A0A1H9QVS6_9BACI|nr:hypothetical protein [Salisediminibacterium haloalkalitolerans]SER64345.1 hypothetical protein SAMN05444126_103147 [Salisediminibacterium haloalkalitolerans]
MLREHAKLLRLMQQTGEIVGRKKLQKMVYIAQQLDLPFTEKFQYHVYGPYSEELTLRVEEVCALNFVEEIKEEKASYTQYRYQLDGRGEEFLAQADPEAADAETFARFAADLNQQTARFLELVSTIFYFSEMEKPDVALKIRKLKAKQNYSDEEIDSAYEYIAHLQHVLGS